MTKLPAQHTAKLHVEMPRDCQTMDCLRL